MVKNALLVNGNNKFLENPLAWDSGTSKSKLHNLDMLS
jgi:hypothetical protein